MAYQDIYFLAHIFRSAFGVRAVEVHALDDAARRFYLKYGFVSLRDDRCRLFPPIQVIRQLRLPPL